MPTATWAKHSRQRKNNSRTKEKNEVNGQQFLYLLHGDLSVNFVLLQCQMPFAERINRHDYIFKTSVLFI